MNYQNLTQAYLRPKIKIGMRQQSRRRPQFDISFDSDALRTIARLGLMLLPVVIVAHMVLTSIVTDIGEDIALVAEQHSSLADKNIELLAQKARITAPQHVQFLAAEKLSLVLPEKGQVRKFNRRPGTFTYL